MTERRVWQLCPMCHGTKLVSVPPYIAGDRTTFTTSSTGPWPCQLCAATGIIAAPPAPEGTDG